MFVDHNLEMLEKSYQFTGIYFGHLGQQVRNNRKQSGSRYQKSSILVCKLN